MIPILLAMLVWIPALVGLGQPLVRLAGGRRVFTRGSAALVPSPRTSASSVEPYAGEKVRMRGPTVELLGIGATSNSSPSPSLSPEYRGEEPEGYRARSGRRFDGWAFACAGLYGLMSVACVVTAVAFFAATGGVVPAVLCAVGWLLFVCSHGVRRPHKTTVAVLLVIALLTARGQMGYDTGLYHLQAVKWITQGPAPKGLANLHGRLGFNAAWFAAAAGLELPGMRGKSLFVLNGLLVFFAALPAAAALRRVARHGRVGVVDTFLILALYPMAEFAVRRNMLSSLYPDLAIVALTLLATAMWLKSARNTPHLVLLSAFAFAIKPSALPLLAGAAAAGVWCFWRFKRTRGRMICVSAIGVSLLLLTMSRSVWLSGCLIYPAASTRIAALPWAVPADRVAREAATIANWARWRSTDYANDFVWVGRWSRNVFSSPPIPATLALFVIAVALAIARRRRTRGDINGLRRRAVFAVVLLAGGTAFWFLTAPDPRFGLGYFFGFVATFAAVHGSHLRLPWFEKPDRPLIVAIGCVFFIILCDGLRYLNRAPWLSWPHIATARRLQDVRTVDGVTLHIPTGDDRAWDAPLPSTTGFDQRLRADRDAAGRITMFRVE